MSTIASGPMRALTIRLQDEHFAVEAENVREILDLVPITEVPNASPFVSGLINVRGRVVPLADLRVMFDMDRPRAGRGHQDRRHRNQYRRRTDRCRHPRRQGS